MSETIEAVIQFTASADELAKRVDSLLLSLSSTFVRNFGTLRGRLFHAFSLAISESGDTAFVSGWGLSSKVLNCMLAEKGQPLTLPAP